MAFVSFHINRYDKRMTGGNVETGIFVAGYVFDDAWEEPRRSIEFWIEGPEHTALPAGQPARNDALVAIIKREVAAKHAVLDAAIAAEGGAFIDSAENVETELGVSEIEDLLNPAPPFEGGGGGEEGEGGGPLGP
jgi:hypothetical protein